MGERFLFMVPHEEYRIYISTFDDDMIKKQCSLHLQQHPLLHQNPAISWFHITWSNSSIVGLRKQTNLQLFEFIFVEQCSSFLCGRPLERWIQFSHSCFSWHFIIDISHHACIRIIWDPGIIFGLIGFNFGGSKQHWRFIHKLRR